MATDFIGQGQSSVTSPAALSTADMLVQIDTAIKAILGGAPIIGAPPIGIQGIRCQTNQRI